MIPRPVSRKEPPFSSFHKIPPSFAVREILSHNKIDATTMILIPPEKKLNSTKSTDLGLQKRFLREKIHFS